MKRHLVFLLLSLLLAAVLHAQEGFDRSMDFDEIQEVLDKGIKKPDLRMQALAWYQWALYNESRYGRTDSTFQYLAKSVARFGQTNDTLAYHRARALLATWLAQSGSNREALVMQKEALDYFRRTGQIELETNLLLQMSRNFMTSGDTATALKFRRLFREKNEVLKDTLLELTVLMEEVGRLNAQRRYQEAINLSKRTLDLANRSNNAEYAARSQYNLGLLNNQASNYPAALQYLREAERMYADRDAASRYNIFRQLSNTYAALDSMELAYDYAIRHATLGEIIRERDRTEALRRVTMQYESGEKSRIIEKLEQEKDAAQSRAQEQRFLAVLLAFGLIVALLIGYVVVNNYQHRIQTDRLITHQTEAINQQKIRELENSLKIDTMQSMLEGQEQERKRIAHDLHDSIGGLLSAAKLQLENLSNRWPEMNNDPDLLKIKSLLDDTVAETRQIARNLQPVSLQNFGLVRAVKDLINRLSGPNAPAIDFQHFGVLDELSEPVRLNCYRIIQELLQNSLKHAKAQDILVQITQTPGELTLLVEDDGAGYDPESTPKGMGTGNIVQRVQFLKGEMNIQTQPGQGTSTLISIPVG